MVNREQLIGLLNQAVVEAHANDPDALGVVFFGSRTRPTLHPCGPTRRSDVDLVLVYKGVYINPIGSLRRAVDLKLNALGLKEDISNVIIADRMGRNDKDGIDPYMKHVLQYFDEYSIPITVDPEINRWLQELIIVLGRKSTDRRLIEE